MSQYRSEAFLAERGILIGEEGIALFSGSGIPAIVDANNGDWYFDVDTGQVYRFVNSIWYRHSVTLDYYAESLSVSSTTSGSYQNKVSLVTPSLLLGDYKLSWSFKRRTDYFFLGTIEAQIRNNSIQEWSCDYYGEDDYNYTESNFKILKNISGVNTIDLRYRNNGSGRSYISESVLLLSRMN